VVALSTALLLPTAAVAAPAAAPATAATQATAACTVTDATVTWGFKETFRSYISGTIARGQWETTGGASYATPVFTWTGGTGTYDASTATGEVGLPGGIRFTGHGDLLDTTVSDPAIVFTGPGTAQLLFDVSGTLMEDALAGVDNPLDLQRVPFVDIDLSAATVLEQDGALTLTATDAPTVMTAQGFEAFGNYPAGSAFDPLTLVLTAECAAAEEVPAATATPEPTETPELIAAPVQDDGAGWVPWVLGGVVAAGLAGLIVWLTRRRARTAGGNPTSGADR